MCAPAIAWDWLVLDVAYVLALVGGGLTLRARAASTTTWALFGVLSAGVGAFVLGGTFQVQAAAADVGAGSEAATLLAGC